MGRGTFGAHIGYAPVFVGVPDPDKSYAENILEPGSGELDHLLGWYGYWEMRVGKGLSELNAAIYDKPLWNDEGSVVQAPTLREVADLGVGIAAALTGNGWAIAALNLADDAFFGHDGCRGRVPGHRGGRARSRPKGDSRRCHGRHRRDGGRDRLPRAGRRPLETSSADVTSAITWDEQDGWGWDSRAFANGLVGRQAFAGFLGTTTGAVIGGAFSGVTDKFTAGLTTLAAGFGGEAVEVGVPSRCRGHGHSRGLERGSARASRPRRHGRPHAQSRKRGCASGCRASRCRRRGAHSRGTAHGAGGRGCAAGWNGHGRTEARVLRRRACPSALAVLTWVEACMAWARQQQCRRWLLHLHRQ